MATGQFRYTYTNAEGYDAVGFLNDPPSGQCINLPAPAAAEGAAATATVFLDADCSGDTSRSRRPQTPPTACSCAPSSSPNSRRLVTHRQQGPERRFTKTGVGSAGGTADGAEHDAAAASHLPCPKGLAVRGNPTPALG